MDRSKKVLLAPVMPELHNRGRCGCWCACGVQSHKLADAHDQMLELTFID